jgi:hypothetical protein
MFGAGLQILANCQKIHISRAHVIHHLAHGLAIFAQPHHDARFGKDRRI